jgi:hypothetical protein
MIYKNGEGHNLTLTMIISYKITKDSFIKSILIGKKNFIK